MSGSCSGRGKPRPYKATRQVCHLRRERACPFRRTQERSVTWRSDLFIYVSFTNTNMPTPGPGPQARCGKGVWSPEDQGDRCRVPRSFGPSGAGREQVKLLKRIQQDDLPTKGDTACGPTPHPALRATFPSKGKAANNCFPIWRGKEDNPSPPRGRWQRCASPSSNPPTAGPSPPRGIQGPPYPSSTTPSATTRTSVR